MSVDRTRAASYLRCRETPAIMARLAHALRVGPAAVPAALLHPAWSPACHPDFPPAFKVIVCAQRLSSAAGSEGFDTITSPKVGNCLRQCPASSITCTLSVRRTLDRSRLTCPRLQAAACLLVTAAQVGRSGLLQECTQSGIEGGSGGSSSGSAAGVCTLPLHLVEHILGLAAWPMCLWYQGSCSSQTPGKARSMKTRSRPKGAAVAMALADGLGA